MVENAPVPKLLRLWLAGAVVAVGIVFIFVVFQAARMSELSDVRAMDLAQVARNMATGHGFTTQLIRPLTLAEVPRVENHPDLMHAPVHPAFMSLLFRAFGASGRAVSWASGLPFLLTVALVFWLGLHAFSRKVGTLSALILGTNAVALQGAASGTEGALVGFFFTLTCLILVYHQGRSALRLPLAAATGILTALLYLTHFIWIMAFAPVLLVLILNCTRRQRLPNILAFLIAFMIVVLPWFYRTYRVTGSPLTNPSAYEAVSGTRTYPGDVLFRSFEQNPPGLVAWMFSAPREIYTRARSGAIGMYPLVFSIAGLVTMPFFLVAIIVPLGQAGMDRLRLGLYPLVILLFAALCLSAHDARLLLPLAPVTTVIAVAFFYQLLDLRLRPLTERLKIRWTSVAVTALVVLHAIPLLLDLAPGQPIAPTAALAIRRAAQELNANIQKAAGAEAAPAAVITDMPWAIAWHSDRPAIWLPKNDVDLRRMEQSVGMIRWMVLTPQIGQIAEAENATYWADMWLRAVTGRPVTSGWRVRQLFANGRWVLFERVPDVAAVGTLPAAP